MDMVSLKPLLWLLMLIPVFWVYRHSLVDRPLSYRLAALALRILAVILIILALCRPYILKESNKLHVVFLVDVSESVDLTSARQSLQQVNACIDNLRRSDSWSLYLVADGVRAYTEVDQADKVLEQWSEQLPDEKFRGASRLAQALLATRLSFPADKARRIVLFSDGCETHDDIKQVIQTLRQENIDVQYESIKGLGQTEACIAYLKTNTQQAYEGEIVRMSVKVETNTKMPARLCILNQAVVVDEAEILLDPNSDNIFHFDVEMTTPGDTPWTAELIAAEDYFQINNQATCTINVGGKPRILVLHEKPVDVRRFRRVMAEQGFDIDVRPSQGVPSSLEELLSFDAVIIANVAATEMSPGQMELVKRYVTDFGGGLVMTGSNNSFGLGGYYKTPIEEVLPLTSRFEKEKEQPSVALVLVIDKSGSMSGAPIALARQAAKATVELLGQQDKIGVVAFDSQAFILCEMRSAMDAEAIKSAIDTLASGGGTSMYPGMMAAFEMLDATSAKIKHVIILSDGRSSEANHQGLAAEMADAGITLSTIALGDADRPLLASLAEIGRGRYYETTDPSNIPHIFTKETVETSRSAVKEDIFSIVQTADHTMLAGFDENELPVILGYVMTRLKPATQLLLAVDTGDPLLAFSRYGLGAGMAYTSDLSDRWATQWLDWSRFGQFWAQAIRSVIKRNTTEGMYIQQNADHKNWNIDIYRYDKAGRFVTGIDFDVQIADEMGNVQSHRCKEIGLGHYSLNLDINDQKQLSVRLYDPEYDQMAVLHYHKSYPAEYNLAAEQSPILKNLQQFDLENILRGITPIKTRRPVSYLCLLVALLAMTTGLLMRRL